MKGNLFVSFNKEKLERISLVMLLLWVCFPIIVMLLNLFGADGIYVYLFWLYDLYFIGAIGYIVALIYCYRVVNFSKRKITNIIFDYLPMVFLLLFLLWSLASSFLAADRHMAFYGMIPYSASWFTFLFFGGFLLLSIIVSKNEKFIFLLARIFLIISTVMALITIADNSFSTKANVVNPYTNCFHYQSIFYNTNHYAYYLLIVIVVSLFFVLCSEIFIERLVCVFVYVLNLSLLILNNTLGAYLSLFVISIVICVYNFIKGTRYRNVSLVMFFIFLTTSFFSTFYTNNIVGSLLGMTTDIANVMDNGGVDSAGSGRGELWKTAIKCIKAQPIFGCGFENQGAFVAEGDGGLFVTAPHNFFLFLAKHTGIPGLVFVLSTFIVGFLRLVHISNKRIVTLASEFIIIAYMMSAFFGVVRFYTEPYFVIVLGICMGDCLVRRGKARENE